VAQVINGLTMVRLADSARDLERVGSEWRSARRTRPQGARPAVRAPRLFSGSVARHDRASGLAVRPTGRQACTALCATLPVRLSTVASVRDVSVTLRALAGLSDPGFVASGWRNASQ
jgi:hypothetical protein